jgi:hypothetical protein
MRRFLLIARNITIIGVMLWMALSYQNNHRFGPQPMTSAASRSLS